MLVVYNKKEGVDLIFDEKINAGAKSEDSETCMASKQETDSSDNTEWRTFLAEYEAWIDRYVELTGKIKENPQDIFLLADQTAMLLEMSCLKEKSGKFEKKYGIFRVFRIYYRVFKDS